jgi:hypothetical protein
MYLYTYIYNCIHIYIVIYKCVYTYIFHTIFYTWSPNPTERSWENVRGTEKASNPLVGSSKKTKGGECTTPAKRRISLAMEWFYRENLYWNLCFIFLFFTISLLNRCKYSKYRFPAFRFHLFPSTSTNPTIGGSTWGSTDRKWPKWRLWAHGAAQP